MLYTIYQKLKENIINGGIVASCDKVYYYHWTRDAALVIQSIHKLYRNKIIDYQEWKKIFIDYYHFENNLDFNHAQGNRGEPKYHIDGSLFHEKWGRPQNDGVALRIITLYQGLELMEEDDYKHYLKKFYCGTFPARNIIKLDLEYLGRHYLSSYDLWEEVKDINYFNLICYRKAFECGVELARINHDYGASEYYHRKLKKIKNLLKVFNNDNLIVHLMTDGLDKNNKDNLDVSNMMSVYLYGNLEELENELLWKQVYNLLLYFKEKYEINKDLIYLGRYKNDKYHDGNAWIICTLYFVGFLVRLKQNWKEIEFNMYMIKIFSLLNYEFNFENLQKIINRYLNEIYLLGENINWSEQINGKDKTGLSVNNLTWNFAVFIDVYLNNNSSNNL